MSMSTSMINQRFLESRRAAIESDHQADTGQGVWAKSEGMGKNAKAHFWRQHHRPRMADYSVSACCMVYPTSSLRAADEHAQRCKTCEKKFR